LFKYILKSLEALILLAISWPHFMSPSREIKRIVLDQQRLVVMTSSSRARSKMTTNVPWHINLSNMHVRRRAMGVALLGLAFVVLLFGQESLAGSTSTSNMPNPDDPDGAATAGGNGSGGGAANDDDLMARPVTVGIEGYGKAVGRREGGIDVWRGIPYAAPPVGNLRFAPPEPTQPWSPTRLDASRFAPDCWQSVDPVLNPSDREMSEDCLYLNIWTPAGHAARSRQGKLLSGQRLLPVMVWFHGGAFQQGGSNRLEYNGRRLAERDVIVVTLNYRLGALGFLVSSSDQVFGNFGLMDQRASIYWIHENIESFGGDPNSVTLFGESAGAVMTGLHLMMEGSGRLFQKAIMQSNPLGYTFRSVVVADFIGEALKRKVDCFDVACLRAERVEEIMGAQVSLMGVPRSVGDFFTWGPTLTKEAKVQITLHRDGSLVSRSEEHRLPRLDASPQFISEWRLNRETTEAKSGSAKWSAVNVTQPLSNLHLIPHDIPIIIGSNKNEGEMFVHSAFPVSMAKVSLSIPKKGCNTL
jgi:carboxylesterase type B